MSNQEILDSIKRIVANHYNFSHDSQITTDNVFIVWFCKALQNWKALAATDVLDDDTYFEMTHNGDNNETYVDVYTPAKHFTIRGNSGDDTR